MRLNKKALAQKLKISERSLSTWQREGMPVLEHGRRGQPNTYDLAAVVRWIEKTGRGIDLRMGMEPIALDALKRELGLESPPAQASPSAAPQPRELAFVDQMFRLAGEALDAGTFEQIEPAMRAALRRVPEKYRDLVMVHAKVMDRLIQEVHDELCRMDAEDREAGGTGCPPAAEMSDADADWMGKFWYAVAAGEVRLAAPRAQALGDAD